MTKCKFCDQEVETTLIKTNLSQRFDCPLCGPYVLTDSACDTTLSCTAEEKILFSGYLRNRSEDDKNKQIFAETLNRIPSLVAPYKRLTASDKINNIIKFVGRSSSYIGDGIPFDQKTNYTQFFCKNPTEIRTITKYIEANGLITLLSLSGGPGMAVSIPGICLQIKGWAEYEKLKEININSKKAFVAMNFDKEFDTIYKDAIDPACDACGFKAYRVDLSEHNEKICDRIISDIRESRFMIADFTGQKHGVYFETGYAQGLGLPVIWTCRKDEVDGKLLHFDTRQFNYIDWTSIDELRKRLTDRIKATI